MNGSKLRNTMYVLALTLPDVPMITVHNLKMNFRTLEIKVLSNSTQK